MGDDLREKFRQVRDVFDDRIRSPGARQNNERYIERLRNKLKEWRSDVNGFAETVADEKIHEIDGLYKRYQQESDERYSDLKKQLETNRCTTDVNDHIDRFNAFCQTNAIEKRIQLSTFELSKDQLTDKIRLRYVPYGEVQPDAPITPLRPVSQPASAYNPPQTYRGGRTASNDEELTNFPQRSSSPADITPGPTKLYPEKSRIRTLILTDTVREYSGSYQPSAAYAIDSVDVPTRQSDHRYRMSVEDERAVVAAYVDLLKKEKNYRQRLASASGQQIYQGIPSTHGFSLKKLNQVEYSTILFQECATENNCLVSSTKHNEVIVYNSKLEMFIVLRHDKHQEWRNRFYFGRHEKLSSQVADMSYCASKNQYVIATKDDASLYLFDVDQRVATPLGALKDRLPLRRIHSHGDRLYCIVENNYLLEYYFADEFSRLELVQSPIRLFDPSGCSQDTPRHLIDVACNDQYLAVVYASDRRRICLQLLDRQTRAFRADLLLEESEAIYQANIRLEPIPRRNSFIYVNGSHLHLKEIDFSCRLGGEVMSTVTQFATPTNVCFLADGRLAILHEDPHYLSVHETAGH